MKAFWVQLTEQQQMWLIALGVVVIASVGYTQIYEPMAEARDQARAEATYHQATLQWLNAIEPAIETLRQDQTTTRARSDQSLLSLADQTARAKGLAGALSRIEPAGDDEVSVWLDGASFDDVMGWLTGLSVEQGVRVVRLSVSLASDPTTVDVRVSLARQG